MSDQAERSRLAPVVEALRTGEAGAALTTCATLLGETPDNAALLHLAAIAAFRVAQPDLAQTYADRALGLRPDHAPLLLLAGRIAAVRGHHAEAAAALLRLCERAPKEAEAAFLLCLAWLKAGGSAGRRPAGQSLGTISGLCRGMGVRGRRALRCRTAGGRTALLRTRVGGSPILFSRHAVRPPASGKRTRAAGRGGLPTGG